MRERVRERESGKRDRKRERERESGEIDRERESEVRKKRYLKLLRYDST